MTNPFLTLEGVSFALPDGRTLFSDLNETFDMRRTGLVGRNGVGKSVLARLLAGQMPPSQGRCLRSGRVHYLAQQVTPPADATIATLAGVQHTLDALARIEAGSSSATDFDSVGDRWDIRQRLQAALHAHGLGHFEATTPAAQLSGGEAMRASLLGAWLSDADFLILDEPSNHLDHPHRQTLIQQLQHWPRGLLVLSHDRQLLQTMERVVELSSLGLRSYGGDYRFYAQAKALERQQALAHLDKRKQERQREALNMQEQRERQARRQARGNRQGKTSNQAKILLDRQKERSQASASKLNQQQAAVRQRLAHNVHQAAQQVQVDASISLHAIPAPTAAQRRIVVLEAAVLPFVTTAMRHIDLVLNGQQRVAIVGPNGCGKSTLLKLIAGQLDPVSGRRQGADDAVYLDQQLSHLSADQTALALMQSAHPAADDSALRMQLAHLDLNAQKIVMPNGLLSGGERLKIALACVLYADPPPPLLLLDEPSNHLDLPSVQALETMLRSYPGALVVVSHDEVFLEQLGLTHRLMATEQGWRLTLW